MLRKTWFLIKHTPLALLMYPAILLGRLWGAWSDCFWFGVQDAERHMDSLAKQYQDLWETNHD